MKVALIAGASGAIGKELLTILLNSNSYEKVIAVSRRPLIVNHPILENRVVDFDDVENQFVNDRVDDVFITLGTTIKKAGSKENFLKVDYDYVMLVAKVARNCGASRILVVSSVGANASSSNFYLNTKGRMEEGVCNSGIEGVYIFRPSLLVAKRDEFRLGEKISEWLSLIINPLMLGKLRRYRSIKVRKVAHAMYDAAQNIEEGRFIIESEEMNR